MSSTPDPSHSSSDLRARMQAEPKLAPRGPANKKEAAKEAFFDAALNAKAIAQELLEDFRNSDRFFKYKAGVIASWLLLSVATLFVACPSSDTTPSNELSATAQVQKVTLTNPPITTIYLENTGDDDWTKVVLTLNGTYTAALPSVRARGGKAVVSLSKFSNEAGKAPPDNFKPQRLEVRCAEGDATFNLAAP